MGVLTDLSHQVSSAFSPIFSKRNCKLCSVALHSQAHSTWQKSPGSSGNTHKNGNGALCAGGPAGPEAALCVRCPTFKSKSGPQRALAELESPVGFPTCLPHLSLLIPDPAPPTLAPSSYTWDCSPLSPVVGWHLDPQWRGNNGQLCHFTDKQTAGERGRTPDPMPLGSCTTVSEQIWGSSLPASAFWLCPLSRAAACSAGSQTGGEFKRKNEEKKNLSSSPGPQQQTRQWTILFSSCPAVLTEIYFQVQPSLCLIVVKHVKREIHHLIPFLKSTVRLC